MRGRQMLKYLAVRVAGVVLGGTGIAAASQLGLTQIGFATPSGTNVAHVDSGGNLQVGGTVNVGNLPSTQPVNGTVNVGNLPATQPVNGTVNVGNLPAAPTTGVVLQGSADAPGFSGAELFDTDVHTYRSLGLYIKASTGTSSGGARCEVYAISPGGANFFVIDTFALSDSSGFTAHRTYDIPPTEIEALCVNSETFHVTYTFMLTGRTG